MWDGDFEISMTSEASLGTGVASREALEIRFSSGSQTEEGSAYNRLPTVLTALLQQQLAHRRRASYHHIQGSPCADNEDKGLVP